jgi:hypothetical protein
LFYVGDKKVWRETSVLLRHTCANVALRLPYRKKVGLQPV